MENVLSMSVSEQNSFTAQLFKSAFHDNKKYAEENDENVADYFLRDFDQNPEGWNFAFDYSYDEVSAVAKEHRRSILLNMLVSEGFITENE